MRITHIPFIKNYKTNIERSYHKRKMLICSFVRPKKQIRVQVSPLLFDGEAILAQSDSNQGLDVLNESFRLLLSR